MNRERVPSGQEFDFVIVGSGFGGSVSAMRLSEKGYRVLMLERGKRYGTRDFSIKAVSFFLIMLLD